MINLIADILARQDPEARHTILTRITISTVLVGVNLVYAGFFGVLGAVAVYLFGVELAGLDRQWMLLPLGVAIVVGLKTSAGHLSDYWRNYGR